MEYKNTASQSEPLLESTSTDCILMQRNRRWPSTLTFLWILSCLTTAFMTAFLTEWCLHQSRSPAAFPTDFKQSQHIIRLQEQVFTGSPLFDDSGHEYFPDDSPSLAYIGAGKEVDTAWAELSKERYFLLTDNEARRAWGEEYVDYWDDLRGGYLAGADVFHTLHCLNHLRMSLYPDVYHLHGLHGADHQVHCIDHIRQILMCHADLTPNPSKFYSGIGRNYIISDQPHTCRDFSAIRKWASERFNGSSAVSPRYRDGSPRAEFYAPELLKAYNQE